MRILADRLKAAREAADLSISDIAARTKIKPAFVQAIERGEFERLPGPFFARAFLKSYAKEVGLDPAEVAAEYDAATGPPAEAAPDARHHEPEPLLAMSQGPISRGASGWPAVLTLAALLLGVNLFRSTPDPDAAASPVPVATTGVALAAASPQPEAVRTTGEVTTPDVLRLEIRPAEELWISADADGDRVLYRLLAAGEPVSIEARQQLSLRIGNAAAFEYSINGVPGRAIGGRGEVRDVHITRANYRTYYR